MRVRLFRLSPDPDPAGGGQGDDDKPAAPEVAFATKAEYTASVQKAVNAALAPKLKALTAAQEELEQLRPLQDQVAELQDQVNGKQKTAAEKEAERDQKHRRALEALQGQVTAAQQERDKVAAAWHRSAAEQYLQGLGLQAGAAPEAAPDIPSLFPPGAVVVQTTEDGRLQTHIVDPVTGLPEQDQLGAMKIWLESKPHLKGPPPSGTGSQGAGPPKPKIVNLDDLTPRQLIALGLSGEG